MNVGGIGNNNIVEENERQAEEKNNVPNNTEEQSNNIEAENSVTSNGKNKLKRKRGCYPKEILEGVNVSGLTRVQVACHLQGRGSSRANWDPLTEEEEEEEEEASKRA
ncbi:hypothetical protein HAX54_023080 [Datura stramonium]|uniref:Uncharacterized protein n=1 Tax=Datura stramonium TaxID=4076 RepID=A0ABS8UX45_DATST|nr:hypothetical protein [Datura stramonium]